MKILGRNFVFGRTIDEALKRADPEQQKGLSHSFDMLGEAAKTYADANAMPQPIAARSTASPGGEGGFRGSPGISVKLTALHPRFECTHRGGSPRPSCHRRRLALKASKADVHFTIDAEEADRLELQLDIFEALLADDEIFANGSGGFGLRSRPIETRRAPVRLGYRGARRMAAADGRLVKGAYWDTEIKRRRSAACPIIRSSRARSRPTCPTSPAPRSCSLRATYPAFATHNANTIGQIKALAQAARFEFQRLHGMGEELYDELAKLGKRSVTSPRRSGSTRPSAATRSCSPISCGGCWRTAPIPASSTASPTSRCR